MGLTTEKLSNKTNNTIINELSCEERHQNVANFEESIFGDKNNKVVKEECQYKHLPRDQRDMHLANPSKDHKNVFHSIEQYFINTTSYKKLDKTKKQNLVEFYHHLRNNDVMNIFKANKSSKVGTGIDTFDCPEPLDALKNDVRDNSKVNNKNMSLNSSTISGDENNNKVPPGTSKKSKIWCQLAYWEECQRVGPLQPVSSSYVHILQSSRPSSTNIQRLSTKVPSYKKHPTTSLNVNDGSKRVPSSTLSKTCVQYSNLNIVDSECSNYDNKSLSTFSDEKKIKSFNQCTTAYSKPPKSVIKEKKKPNLITETLGATIRETEIQDQLCLSSLFCSNLSPSQSTSRTRNKIGKGIILSCEKMKNVPDGDTCLKHDSSYSIPIVGSPPYEKQRTTSTKIDEDLPPYSLHAPHPNVKRRRKESGEMDDTIGKPSSNDKMDLQPLQISEESGEYVWLHNLSHVPVFVTSPTLEPLPSLPDPIKMNRPKQGEYSENSSQQINISDNSDNKYETTNLDSSKANFTVHKILPGYAMKVFDYNKSEIYEKMRKRISRTSRCSNNEGPFDPHAIRISFAKGWSNSQGYSRSDITNCPCWMEVHLVVT